MSNQTESTKTVPELGCDALFSPFPPKPENVEAGKFYVWGREGNYQVVRVTNDRKGFDAMSDDFPCLDYWEFADDLIGNLYGPMVFSENNDPDQKSP